MDNKFVVKKSGVYEIHYMDAYKSWKQGTIYFHTSILVMGLQMKSNSVQLIACMTQPVGKALQ